MIFILSGVVRYATDEDRLKAYIRNGNWDNIICLDPPSYLNDELKWVQLYYHEEMQLQSGNPFYIFVTERGTAHICNDIDKSDFVKDGYNDRSIRIIIDIENKDRPMIMREWGEWELIKEL